MMHIVTRYKYPVATDPVYALTSNSLKENFSARLVSASASIFSGKKISSKSILSLGMIAENPTWLYIPVVNGACVHDNHV